MLIKSEFLLLLEKMKNSLSVSSPDDIGILRHLQDYYMKLKEIAL